jgi:hypothetical protein
MAKARAKDVLAALDRYAAHFENVRRTVPPEVQLTRDQYDVVTKYLGKSQYKGMQFRVEGKA